LSSAGFIGGIFINRRPIINQKSTITNRFAY